MIESLQGLKGEINAIFICVGFSHVFCGGGSKCAIERYVYFGERKNYSAAAEHGIKGHERTAEIRTYQNGKKKIWGAVAIGTGVTTAAATGLAIAQHKHKKDAGETVELAANEIKLKTECESKTKTAGVSAWLYDKSQQPNCFVSCETGYTIAADKVSCIQVITKTESEICLAKPLTDGVEKWNWTATKTPKCFVTCKNDYKESGDKQSCTKTNVVPDGKAKVCFGLEGRADHAVAILDKTKTDLKCHMETFADVDPLPGVAKSCYIGNKKVADEGEHAIDFSKAGNGDCETYLKNKVSDFGLPTTLIAHLEKYCGKQGTPVDNPSLWDDDGPSLKGKVSQGQLKGAVDYIMVNCPQLTQIDLGENGLTNVSYLLKKLPKLTKLAVYNNQLTRLDISANTQLKTLLVNENQLTSLDISANTQLEWLSVANNQLTSLDILANTQLNWLHVNNNQLTSLEISANTQLKWLFVDDNQYDVKTVGALNKWNTISGNVLNDQDQKEISDNQLLKAKP